MTKAEIIKRKIELKKQYIEIIKQEIAELETELMQLSDKPWPERINVSGSCFLCGMLDGEHDEQCQKFAEAVKGIKR